MKNNWVEIAEYVSLAGSVVGTVVAVASKQLVYAAAPASAALLLNVANRRRLVHEAEQTQSRTGEQAQIHRQLSEDVAFLRASILALPTQDEIGGVKVALQSERQRLDRLEGLDLNPIQQELSNLQQQYASLTESLARSQETLEQPAVGALETLESAAQMKEQLVLFQSELALQKQLIASVQENLQQLAARPIVAAGLQPDRLSSDVTAQDISTLPNVQAQIDELKSELEKLQEETQNKVIRQDFASLVSAIAVLEQAVEPSRGAIAEIRGQLDTLRDGFERRSIETFQTTTLQQLEQLRSAFAQLQKRVDDLPAAAEPVDVAGVEQLLAQIAASVAQTKAEMESRMAQMEALSVQPIPENISQLREQYKSLLKSVADVSDRLDGLPPASQIDTLEIELAKAIQRISQLQTEMSNVSVPNSLNLERQMQEFSTELARVSQHIATLEEEARNRFSSDDFASLVSAVAVLEQTVTQTPNAIASLRSQLAALSEQVNNFSTETFQTNTLEQLEEVKGALAELTQRIDELPPPPKSVDRALEQLEEVKGALAGLTQRIDELPPPPESVDRALEQLELVKGALAELTQRIDELPPPPESIDLTGVEDRLGTISTSVAEAKAQMESRIALLQALDVQPIQEEIGNLKNQYASILESLSNFSQRLDRLPSADRVENLETTIRQLRQQINDLPPVETVDLAGVEEALAKVVAAIAEAKIQMENKIDKTAIHLQKRIDDLPPPTEPIDLTGVEEVIAKIVQALAEAKTQMESRIAAIESLDLNSIQSNISLLQAALDNVEMRQVPSLQTALAKLQTDLENRRDESQNESSLKQVLQGQLEQMNELLKAIQPYEYELVFDRPDLRSALEEALSTAVDRLIIVCPWLSRSGLDRNLTQKLEAFLQRNGHLDIGWGNLQDIEAGDFPKRINRQWQTNNSIDSASYNALNDLERLRTNYPNQVRLKVLGTHENFLVLDRASALLTTYNFLSANAHFPEREVGVRTTDPRIIHSLIDRFNDSALNASNAEIVRKRGLERLDLGDYQGAIQDYTQALEIDPNNANVYNNRGIAYSNLGEQQAAIADYTQAIKLNPTQAVYYFNRGFARLNLEKYQEAIADFTSAIAIKAEDADAYFYRGEAHRLQGNYESAIEDYNRAVFFNSEDAVAYNNRGLAHLYLGDRNLAIDDYTKALRINPDDAVTYFNRGVALSTDGKYPAAIEDFDYALTLDTEYALAYHHRGLARAEIGEQHSAIEDLQKAAKFFARKGDVESSQQAISALQKLQA